MKKKTQIKEHKNIERDVQQTSTILCFRTRKVVTILSQTIWLRIDLRKQYTLYDEMSLGSDLHSTRVLGYDDMNALTICDPQICYELECVIDEEIMIFALKS